MVAPVPDAHLSFIEAVAVFSPVSSPFLNMMILASCPPSSMTRADVGVQVLHRQRDRVDLLHELAAGGRAQGRRARAGHEHAPVRRRTVGEGARWSSSIRQHVLGLLRVVPLVVAPEDLLVGRIDDDGFDRRAAHVHSDREPPSVRCHASSSTRCRVATWPYGPVSPSALRARTASGPVD